MSMKSTLMAMAAMAMVGAQTPENLYAFGNGYPTGKLAPKKKCEQKKCKSCKNFMKNEVHGGSCPWRRFVKPMDVACEEHYKKRKK